MDAAWGYEVTKFEASVVPLYVKLKIGTTKKFANRGVAVVYYKLMKPALSNHDLEELRRQKAVERAVLEASKKICFQS